MLYCFDDYYNLSMYNDFRSNLVEKKIPFNEYISTKDYKFYIELERDPFILKYFEPSRNQNLFLVNKVKELTIQDEYNYRRRDSIGNKRNLNLAINDAYKFFVEKNAGNYAFFHLNNREAAEKLSSKIGRIYWMGKYLQGRYNIFLTNNMYLSQYVDIDNILAVSDDIFDAELKINYEIFKFNDRLKKYSETPYFVNSKYVAPKILADKYKSIKKN